MLGNEIPKGRFLSRLCGVDSDIDKVIVSAAPEWPLEKISAIDRNILRLGLSELLYADRAQVPAKVAINEAIELAKTFGSSSSSTSTTKSATGRS